MSDGTLVARTRQGDGRLEVLSPALGVWTGRAAPGQIVGPGTEVGRLRVLNRTYALVLPSEARGWVVARTDLPDDRKIAVEYGQPLLTLDLEGLGAADAGATTGTSDAPPESGTIGFTVTAPTDGVFYRRPSPDAPPFVDVGARIRHGQAVGLIESMKTFNQILFGGTGYPDDGEVVEIKVEDTEEVRSGQVLMVVR